MGKNVLLYLFLYVPALVHSQEREQVFPEMEESFTKGIELLFTDKDSSYYYFDRALDLAIGSNDHQSQLDILGYLIYANGYHYDLENYNLNISRTEKILFTDSLKTKIEDYAAYLNPFLLDKGNYFFKTREYGKAKAPFLELQAKYEKIPISEMTSEEASMLFSIYNFLATIYKHSGKYDLSEQYYLRNKSLVEQSDALSTERHSYLTNIDQLLAQLYDRMGQHRKASDLLYKALTTYKAYYREDKKFKNTLITVYQKLAATYMKQDSLTEALNLLDESREYLLADDPFQKESLLLHGDIHLAQREDEKALEQYQKALESFKTFRQNRPHQDVAKVYGKIAELYLKRSDHEAGLQFIQKAFNASGNSIEIDSYAMDVNPAQVFSKRQLLHLLDLKLQLLQEAHNSTKNSRFLDAAVRTNKNMLRTFDLLKKEFDSKLDKQFLAETAYPIFHRMLGVTYTAYQNNGSSDLLELALNITEKNKDFLLLEALRSANATTYGAIPQMELDKEAQYRAKITFLEKKNFDVTDSTLSINDSLFRLKKEYYDFLDSLKSNYPKYHDLKYQNRELTITELRNTLLKNNRALLSYAVTEHDLFAIVLDGSKEKFMKLPFTNGDREDIRIFYRTLSSPSIIPPKGDITTMGQGIFDKILRGPLVGFEAQDLTIVPDDILHYLPFDILQENGSYLLTTKNISYGNSITSLLELTERKRQNNGKLLAFAPSFKEEVVESEIRMQYGQLLYNDDEVNKIDAFYDSQIYLNDSATLPNFLTKVPEFGMVHLATHASANDEFPDYSYLAFSSNDGQGSVLYVKDLYNTSINADMVTLSACQTGIGKLQKGQGMLSLSKGFYYAGAKSLVNTLWKINDKSSVTVMEFFYKNLSEGESKKEALRHAKLQYLETTDDELLRHPYYWSAFVVSGDTSPVTQRTLWPYLAGGALLLIAAGFFVRRSKFRG